METKPLCAGSALVLLLALHSVADPLTVWHPRSPLPTANALRSITYGNGQFIAVGFAGTLVTSTNGVDWNLCPSGVTAHLTTITFGRGRFVIGGASGLILWSDDATNWTRAPFPLADDVDGIGFGTTTNLPDGLFVAFASPSTSHRATILTSANGVDWMTNTVYAFQQRPSGVYSSIAVGNDRFVASGPRSALAFSSASGTNWGQCLGIPAGPVAFGNGLFIISEIFQTLSNGLNLVTLTSVDGSAWPGLSYSGSYAPTAACFGAGRFVVVGDRGATGTSTNATDWACQLTEIDGDLYGVAFGAGLFVAVGKGGVIMSSPDGLVWTLRSHGPARNLYGVAPQGDGFVAVGSTGILVCSSNGAVWETIQTPTTNALIAVLKAGSHCLASGANGTILSGDNFAELMLRNTGTTQFLEAIASGADVFVTVGTAGTILSSRDTVNWSAQSSPVTNNLWDVTYGGGNFVAAGDNGVILSSPDSSAWTLQNSGGNDSFRKVKYGAGRFVALAATLGYSPIATSTDGIHWARRTVNLWGATSAATAFGFGSGLFLIVSSYQPFVSSSPDGENWSSTALPIQAFPVYAGNVAFNNGNFLTVGAYGAIFQSDAVVRVQTRYDGLAHLSIEGPRTGAYRIESFDPQSPTNRWQPRCTISTQPFSWTDTDSTPVSNRLYRAVLIP